MDKIPTEAAERIYDVLQKYAEAHPNYYERESFIFHYGVLRNKSNTYRLKTLDGRRRSITRDGMTMTMTGKGAAMVNSIINKILGEYSLNRDGFTIVEE